MNIRLLALFVTFGCFAIGCGGGSNEVSRVRTPAPAAPRDAIAFGAVGDAGQHALYLVLPDGTAPQKLTSEVQSVSFPRWSPDGDRIAYVVAGGRGPGTKAALRVYNFDGAITTTISEDVLASGDEAPMAWSPDGTRLAFIEAMEGGGAGSGTLRLYSVQDGALLAGPSVVATSVDWSSRNELVIVAPDDGSATDVYTLQPGDSEPRLALALEGIESAPAWSLDGETLAFWNGPTVELTQRTLFLLPGGDGSAQEIGPGMDASWSSGGLLGYSGSQPSGERGVLDIYTLAPDDEAPARRTRSITLDRWPSWSPQEDAVAYLGLADASTAFLCIIELETRNNDCLNLPGLTPSPPAWSPY